MTISIQETLKLPIMNHMKLLAGFNGLDNQINWVTIVEVLEDVDRLQQGEFLLTTGYGLFENEDQIKKLEELFALHKLSGIAIYTGLYIDDIPERLIHAANENNLPLFELPSNINFSAITKEILESIVNNQMEQLQYSLNIHKQLTKLVSEGQGFYPITETLSNLTEGNVIVFSEWTQPIHYVENNHHISFTDDGTLLINGEKMDLKQTLQEIYQSQKPEKIYHPHYFIIVHPLIVNQSVFGGIVLVKNLTAWSYADEIAIEHAATVYAIDHLKNKAVEETQSRLQGDFLEELLQSRFDNEKNIIEQGQKFDYDITQPQSVIQLKLPDKLDEVEKIYYFDKLNHLVKQVLTKKNIPSILRTSFNSVIALFHVQGNTKQEQKKDTKKITESILKEWKYFYSEIPINIGIGKSYNRPSLLPKSAKEADQAITFINLFDNKEIIHFEDLGTYHLLIEMMEVGLDLKSFYENNLDPILTHRKQGIDLFHTLDMFFQNDRNIQTTAAKLFIHRHTLTYRLAQIEKKTELSLKSQDDIVKLQLSIMAYKIVHYVYNNNGYN
ncbi:PucR family transcriptional regulator [Salipaludibacillus daqingensis]|uniref:PucR family transcriptional regulator n=1 Tax=Salipaludibacillus daqingensis TaxID=3041001 RepID=UPI00247387D5|nr:PucR family transcriptional regulator [Salipaludibacillus daqingensis]